VTFSVVSWLWWVGWLEPLLDRIARNSSNVVTPVIDVIDDDTFQYHHGPALAVGGFDWNLQVANLIIQF